MASSATLDFPARGKAQELTAGPFGGALRGSPANFLNSATPKQVSQRRGLQFCPVTVNSTRQRGLYTCFEFRARARVGIRFAAASLRRRRV